MVDLGIDQKDRSAVVDRLNKLLANEYVLYTKTLKYHWNVVGSNFGPLHKLFGDQYEALLTFVDDTAERVRALGHLPLGTLQEFKENATIQENPGHNPDDMGMIHDLLTDYETIIKQIRDDIDFTADVNEMGTNNFLADLIEKLEKTAWMLRAHLQ